MSAPDRVILGPTATLGGRSGFGLVEGIAIADGRIVAAGRASEIEPLIGTGTRVWRLSPGQLAVPGITDAHLHLVAAALAATQLDLSGVMGRHAALAAIRAAHVQQAAAGDADGWLLGHGWSMDRLGGRTRPSHRPVGPRSPCPLGERRGHGRGGHLVRHGGAARR